MKKNRILITLLFTVLMISSCVYTAKRIKGNGNTSTVTRQIGEFTRLQVAGSMEVFLSQGPAAPARIEAESNIQPYIELNRKGDQLEIKFRNNLDIQTSQPVKIYLTAPHVNGLSMAGSGDIHIQDTLRSEDEIRLNLAGSGNIELSLNSPVLHGNITGSGDMILGGNTRDIDVNIVGSGDFKGDNLKCEQADIKIAGSGNASLYASIKLKATILGSGDVYYQGNPTIESSSTGAGNVVKKQ